MEAPSDNDVPNGNEAFSEDDELTSERSYDSDSESSFDSCATEHMHLSRPIKQALFHSPHICELENLQNLCPLCEHWLKHLLCRTWEGEDYAHIRMGTFNEIEARTACLGCQTLCRVVAELPKRRLNRDEFILLEVVGNADQKTGRARGPDLPVPLVNCHLRHESIWTGGNPYENTISFRGFRTDFIDSMLVKEKISWGPVIEWIDSSLRPSEQAHIQRSASISKHFKNRIGSSTVPLGMILISISKGSIVPMTDTKGPLYAALSYVWGSAEHELVLLKSNLEELQRPGRLRKYDVPKIIIDSMTVCTHLGLDYLWVDRVCIIQDDPVAKMPQLEAMGQIYSGAFVTLVSPERDGVQFGFHGVSQPRNPQGIPLGPITLVPNYESALVSLEESTWSHRGWTYQEGFLSERLLLFGQDMLYMMRRNKDSKTIDYDDIRLEGLQGERQDRPLFCCNSHNLPGEGYQDQVMQYSLRQLTFDSDVLNAFLGVLALFGKHYYGIPLLLFDESMLWFHLDWNSQPRIPTESQSMPTWSWISTKGGVKYSDPPGPLQYKRILYSVAAWARVVVDSEPEDFKVERLDDIKPQRGFKGPYYRSHRRGQAAAERLAQAKSSTEYDPVLIAQTAHMYFAQTQEKNPDATERMLWKFGMHDRRVDFEILQQQEADARIDYAATWPRKTIKFTNYILELLTSRYNQPWYNPLGTHVKCIDPRKRKEALLRVAKPILSPPSLGLSDREIRNASRLGRIIVRAPKLTAVLQYKDEVEDGLEDAVGRHSYSIEHTCRGATLRLGTVDLTDFHHQELWEMMSMGELGDTIQVSCIALSLWEGELYNGAEASLRKESTISEKGMLRINVMVVRDTSDGASRRLGLGQVDVNGWLWCQAKVETTILE
jgi:hypothetical protein